MTMQDLVRPVSNGQFQHDSDNTLDSSAIPDCSDDGLDLEPGRPTATHRHRTQTQAGRSHLMEPNHHSSPALNTEIVPQQMRSEKHRNITFYGYPTQELASFLARSGFYLAGADGRVRCAFCGLESPLLPSPASSRQDTNTAGPVDMAQSIVLGHWKHARSYCPFLMSQDVENVTENELTTEHGRRHQTSGPSTSRLRETDPSIPTAAGEMPGEREREHVRLVRAAPLEGHYYPNGTKEPVASKPAAVSTTAPANAVVTTTTSRNDRDMMMNHNLPAPPFSPPPPPHRSTIPPAQTTQFPSPSIAPPQLSPPLPPRPSSSTATWADIIRTARYPQMAVYKDRLATLRSWPLASPSPVQLAKAGLFHVQCQGSCTASGCDNEDILLYPQSQNASKMICNDSVKCFWCGERFHQWRSSDDALLEHARLSPRCRYVIQLLGHQLHSDVIRASNNGFTYESDRLLQEEPNYSTTTSRLLQHQSYHSSILIAPNHHVTVLDNDVIVITPSHNDVTTTQTVEAIAEVMKSNFEDVTERNASKNII